jgi:hypothetical protein
MAEDTKSVNVEAIDPTKRTSAINDKPDEDRAGCWYNGRIFNVGDQICLPTNVLWECTEEGWETKGRCV